MEPLKNYSQQGGDEFFMSCALTAIGTDQALHFIEGL
jgi:hypothetical protein